MSLIRKTQINIHNLDDINIIAKEKADMIFGNLHFLLRLVCIAFLISCKPVKNISNYSTTYPNPVSPITDNVVIVDSENSRVSPKSSDEITFEGNNNLFELVQRNSSYFDEARDVIIIKGNNTIIRLINTNVLDLSIGQSDTLIIVGNNEKYVIDVNNSMEPSRKEVRTSIVNLKEEKFNSSLYADEPVEDDAPIRLGYFDKPVTAKYAYSYFFEKLSTGEPIYFYELAELYLYGVGIEQSTSKAIELYEYAAAKNHIPSLAKLGAIFTGAFEIKQNRDKAIYYYKRCASLGDEHCKDQVKILVAK